MKALRAALCTTLLHGILISGLLVEAIEPVSTTLAVGAGAGAAAALGNKIYRFFFESCDGNWVSFNETGLRHGLESRLFGQHVASQVVLKAVSGFMNNHNPKKPLVLSLHGLSGTGKNFVSQLIAESIYSKGMASSFVHLFTATAHFPHEVHVDAYKRQLQEWIRGNVTLCPRSMFIFDEMDKMHPGLIDSIQPYLDYYENLSGVSYRKAIFIFLSNTGGSDIVQVALDFWNHGREREEIQLKDLENVLSISVLNSKGGFWHSSLIDKFLVDFFVPFLPLENRHVVLCGLAEMEAKGLTPNPAVVGRMAHELNYFPAKERVFAAQGCKTISSRLDFFIE